MDGQPRPQPHQPAPPEPAVEPAVPSQRESLGEGGGPPAPSGGAVPPTRAPAPARRLGRLRLVFAVLGGMLALLCLGGVGIGFLLYDEATKPQRSDPAAVVNEYFGAVLVDRNDTRAKLFICSSPRLEAVGQLRKEIEDKERELSTAILVNIEDLVVSSKTADSAVVTLNTRRSATVDGSLQSVVDSWRVELVDRGGWRACAAERLS